MLLLKHATCGEERPAIAGVIPQADPCILQDGKVGRCFTLVLLSFYSLWASIFHETQPPKVSFRCPMPTLRPATSRSSCIMMTKRHGSSQLSFCARCSRCLLPSFADTVGRYGQAVCGTYQRLAANKLVETARQRIEASGHPLLITTEGITAADAKHTSCKVCGTV